MMKKHTTRTSLLAFLLFVSLFIISLLMLFGTCELTFLATQLEHNYPVIYLDCGYLVPIAGIFLFLPLSIFMLWQYLYLKKWNLHLSSKHLSTRILTVVAVVSILIVFPGQSIEKSRIEKIAEQHGYQPCPPFTLLMGSATIDAWVKDFSLCNDPEVDRLARYGYRNEPAKIAKLLADRE